MRLSIWSEAAHKGTFIIGTEGGIDQLVDVENPLVLTARCVEPIALVATDVSRFPRFIGL